MPAVTKFDGRPFDECDVVVVGSGPAGLACASLLAKFDKQRVLVLDLHPGGTYAQIAPGGCCHSFKLGKENANSGVHYIGALSTINRAMFDDLTGGQKMTIDRESVYDNLYDKEKGTFQISPGTFEEKMKIKKSSFDRIASHVNYMVMIKVLWWPLAYLVYLWFSFWGYKAECAQPYLDWCRKETFDEKFKKGEENPVWWMEKGDWTSVAAPAENSNAFAAAITTKHYRNGVTHFEGETTETIRRMCNVLKERGGHVCVGARVDKVTFDEKNGNQVTGVMVNENTHIKCKRVVISGAHCMQKILGEKAPSGLKDAIKACGLSPRHSCVFLTYPGKTPEDLGLGPGCFWIHNKYFMSHKKSEHGTLIYLITESEYIKRGPDYLEKKEQIADTMKEYCFKLFPKLRNYDQEEASTPATTEHYVAGFEGVSYGLDSLAPRFTDYNVLRTLRPETDIPGVYFTGQDSLFLGVTGAVFTGVLTAQVMMRTGIFSFFNDNIIETLIKDYKKKESKNKLEESAKSK